jgi:putative transposase
MIELNHPRLSVRRQCELVGLNRSSVYYQPACASPENLHLMRLMDEQYLKTPFYGSRRLTVWLNSRGLAVNRKRVQRLMRLMRLEAIYPRPRTSLAHPRHKIYPYLLRGLAIIHPHQVWSTDITYIPMPQGFMYLVAIMDWYSRYVLSWRLSNTLEGGSVWRPWKRPLSLANPGSSTVTKVCSLPVWSLPGGWRQKVSP